ncbi:nucleotidyl transferase [gamma proteobacterium HTCC5015]|nr:nucleotidyl transferase [gamma proteobacterium HTCC5015]
MQSSTAPVKTAMILAAGRGKRMAPLTDRTPKPLLKVGDKALIEYHLERLAAARFERVVINTAWLGAQIPETLGDGENYGVDIAYSHEREGGLETAGGIIQALPLLGEQPFAVINGDVWCDYPFEQLRLPAGNLGHLVLVDNPPQHPEGDFVLSEQQQVSPRKGSQRGLTFSGIGVYHPQLFENWPVDFIPLRDVLVPAMASQVISGEHYRGEWQDIGTPERLEALRGSLSSSF